MGLLKFSGNSEFIIKTIGVIFGMILSIMVLSAVSESPGPDSPIQYIIMFVFITWLISFLFRWILIILLNVSRFIVLLPLHIFRMSKTALKKNIHKKSASATIPKNSNDWFLNKVISPIVVGSTLGCISFLVTGQWTFGGATSILGFLGGYLVSE